MDVYINFHDKVSINLERIGVLKKDLERLASIEPTEEIRRALSAQHCHQIDTRQIDVLHGFSAKYSWFYRVTDSSCSSDLSEGTVDLGSSEYLPETLEQKK